MEMTSHNTLQSSDNTPPKQFGGGYDTQFTCDSWDRLAVSQCRLEMLRILVKSDIGLNEVEDYNQELNLKLKSRALRERGPLANRGVVRVAMRTKLRDEVRLSNECMRERDKDRRRIKSIYGDKSVTTKAFLKGLKNESDIIRQDLRKKYLDKIAHLRRKFEKKRTELLENKPKKYHGFEDAKVFDKEKFEGIKVNEIKVSQVGDINLSDEEKSVLRLHPKFVIRDKIDDGELEYQGELGYAKLRIRLLKEEEEKLDTEDEEELKMT